MVGSLGLVSGSSSRNKDVSAEPGTDIICQSTLPLFAICSRCASFALALSSSSPKLGSCPEVSTSENTSSSKVDALGAAAAAGAEAGAGADLGAAAGGFTLLLPGLTSGPGSCASSLNE